LSAALDSLRQMTRTATRISARDVTAETARRSALVIAPHPDDETLGCGATVMHKVAAGSPVTILVASDGRHSHRSSFLSPSQLAELRTVEMAEAARRLGLPPEGVRWAGLVDGTIAEHEGRLAEVIADLIAELRPDEVYATCADEPHPDHAAVGRAAQAAVKADGGARLLEYPVWLWNSWPVRRDDRLASTVDAVGKVVRRAAVAVRTAPHRAAKLHALEAHASQLRRPAQVPATEEWPGLPGPVLSAAADSVELFFPVRG
jgi:LmbE family N-acetylglucosaminyl deacetylase